MEWRRAEGTNTEDGGGGSVHMRMPQPLDGEMKSE